MKTKFFSLLAIPFLLSFLKVNAQDTATTWKFGFNFGYNYANLNQTAPLPNQAKIINGHGFRLGLLAHKRLSPMLQFKPKTELSFNRSEVSFNNVQPSYFVFPVSLDLMPHFTIELPNKKVAPYVLVGPNVRLPLTYTSNSTIFNTSPAIGVDLGVGLTIPMKHFNIAPELRFSHGLNNVNQHPSIQGLRFNTFSFVLNIFPK